MDKYIPCTHCVGQDCKICDYRLHKKAIGIIKAHKENLESLKAHFECFTDDDVAVRDYETMWEVLKALESVE